jgi:Flp pilus assembly protein TadD
MQLRPTCFASLFAVSLLTFPLFQRAQAAESFTFPALGGPAPSPEAQAGYEHLYGGSLDEAVKSFQVATQKNPQEAPAYFGKGIIALTRCDLQGGLEQLCKALSAGRTSPWSELYIERIARVLPYCSDAKPFLTLADELLADPKTPDRLRELTRLKYAEWLQERGDYAKRNELLKPLNYVSQWALCGPFDNRDNSGFATAYEPETEVDFEKTVQGRNRRVTWFQPSADATDGKIELTDLFEPHIHTAAYAVTFVKAETAGWAVVRAGAAGALAVWVNGQKAGEIAEYNDWGDDKLAAPVYLRGGWNKVLVKSAVVEETAWAFSLRFCTPTGAPCPGLSVDSSAAALKEFNAAAPEAARGLDAPAEIEAGLYRRVIEALKSQPDNVMLLSTYAYLYDINNLGKKEDHGAPRQLVHAVELAPKCPLLRLQVAGTSNDSNEARQAAEAALASHPDLPGVLEVLANLAEDSRLHVIAEDYARQACAKLGNARTSLSALSLADALIERSDGASSGRGRRDAGSDRRAEAYRLVKKFTAEHPYTGEGYRRLAQLEVSTSARHAVLEQALKSCAGDEPLRRMWSEDLTAMGKERDAAEFLAKEESAHPYSVQHVLAASNQFRRAGDIKLATQLLTKARSLAPENPELMSALALLDHYQGKTAEATQLYAQVLQLKPNSPKVKDYLAELNEGKTTDRQFFAAYDIALKDIQLPKADAFPNDNAINLLHQEVVKLNPNFSASRMVHIVAKVLRPAGVNEISRHQIYYDPERQVVDILRAAVITPTGQELSRADVRDVSTSAAAGVQTRIYDEHHLKQVYFPNIETGSMIDLQYTIRDTGDNLFGDYFSDTFYLSDDAPTVKSQYILDYPKSLHIQNRTFKAEIHPDHLDSPDTKREVMKWENDNAPGLIHEPGMPPLVDELAQLQITTMSSWEEVGKWYWHLANESLDMNEELRGELQKITKDCKTATEKVRAVQQYVIHQVRYLGIEFGRNGYKPHKATESCKARYGDCKDKATLITAMLKELGIDSRLVLIRTVNAGAVPPESLPMPNLFNHCIAYLPNVDGKDFWIDGTADFHQLGDVPYADRTAQVLVVEPNSGKFMRIPVNSPEENLIEQKFAVSVAADGSATLALHDVRHGQWAPGYRELSESDGRYERFIQDYAARRLNGAVAVKFNKSKSTDPGGMAMDSEFKIPTLTSQSGDRKALPAAFEPLFLSQRYANETKRSYELQLHFPWERRTEIEFTLGDPLKVASLPQESSIDEPFGKYSRKVTQDGAKIKIIEDFEFTQTRIKAADYDAFKTFCSKIDELMDEKVLVDTK